MKKTFFIYFFSFFLVLPFVFAIGISPPSYQVEYDSGKELTFDFTIRNNAGAYREATITPKGAMSEYLSLSDEHVTISAAGLKTFRATLSLPTNVDTLRPGRNEIELFVKEIIESKGGFVAGTGVIASIYIFVPFPGEYAEISSFLVADGAAGVNEGDDTTVSFSIINRGLNDLFGTSAEVILQDQNNLVIDRVRYNDIAIVSGELYTEEFSFLTSTVPPGDYYANLFYEYANKRINSSKHFVVGNFSLDLINYTRILEKKGIVPFEIKAQNRWKGYVYVDASVSIPGTSVAKSSREKVADFKSVDLISYLDTTPLALGVHKGTITLTAQKVAKEYSGETVSVTYPFSFELIEPKKVAKESPLAGMSSLSIMLGVMIVLLIVTLIVFFVLMKKKNE